MSDDPQAARARRVVTTDRAPAAIGPYSQAIAVAAGSFLFTAGQIPVDPDTGAVVPGDIRAQTERVLRNLEAILEAAGTSFDRVVKTTCFLADLNDFAAFNEVYARAFPASPPARSTVQVARLPLDVRVEVECVAALPDR